MPSPRQSLLTFFSAKSALFNRARRPLTEHHCSIYRLRPPACKLHPCHFLRPHSNHTRELGPVALFTRHVFRLSIFHRTRRASRRTRRRRPPTRVRHPNLHEIVSFRQTYTNTRLVTVAPSIHHVLPPAVTRYFILRAAVPDQLHHFLLPPAVPRPLRLRQPGLRLAVPATQRPHAWL